jgi:CSLREA domain-containing protein
MDPPSWFRDSVGVDGGSTIVPDERPIIVGKGHTVSTIQRSRPLVLVSALARWLGSLLAAPPPAAAATLTLVVNSSADAPDATPGDGICATTTPGQCALRAAIEEANAQPKGSVITITVPAGTYTLTLGGLTVSGNLVTIDGAGAGQTVITAAKKSQVRSVAAGAQVTLAGLTLTGKKVRGSGGALSNRGTMSLTANTVTGNPATRGGGIANLKKAVMTLSATSVLTNTTNSSAQGTAGDGGGIWNGGTLTLTSSTVNGKNIGNGGTGSNNPAGNGGNGGACDIGAYESQGAG